MQLDEYSEPEPDTALVRPRDDFYASYHPTPSDIYLLIEVADTTRERDLGPKAHLYAVAGIPDHWVVNLAAQQLHVLRDPSPDGYQWQLILRSQQSTAPHAFPTCEVSVSACFGH